jgi:hypothetical protein
MGDVSNWTEFYILLVSYKRDLLLAMTSLCFRCVPHDDCWRQQLSLSRFKRRSRPLVLLCLVSNFFPQSVLIYISDKLIHRFRKAGI